MRIILKALIFIYQKAISPALPPACRFYPTCSEYARVAVDTHGSLVGVYMAFKRLIRCHPFNPGGFDPVPSQIVTTSEKRGF